MSRDIVLPPNSDDKPFFNRLYSFGIQGSKDETEIYLIDIANAIIYPIVDSNGKFVDFPGIENIFLLKPYYKGADILPIIEYRTEFIREEKSGKLMVHWQIQPDGKYWADDDGFGAENDVEIVLYAYLTEDGKFMAPFRIYEIGNVKYYDTDMEEQEKQEYLERQRAEKERI